MMIAQIGLAKSRLRMKLADTKLKQSRNEVPGLDQPNLPQ
jgi:hypothetical protein